MSKATTKQITPGTVVILLSGPYAGTRVVALKNLPNSTILFAGLYKHSRCSVSTTPKSRVIVTSTKIDVSSINIPDCCKTTCGKKSSILKKEDVEKICSQVESIVSGMSDMVKYLKTKFSLKSTFRIPPHQLKF